MSRQNGSRSQPQRTQQQRQPARQPSKENGTTAATYAYDSRTFCDHNGCRFLAPDVISFEVTFPAGTSDLDCKTWARDGQLGEALARALDPHRHGHVSVERALTWRTTANGAVTCKISAKAAPGTLSLVSTRVTEGDGLDLPPFSILPGSNQMASARVRVLGLEKIMAQQYLVSNLPWDVLGGRQALPALEATIPNLKGRIRDIRRFDATSDLVMTVKAGTPPLPETVTYKYINANGRTAEATITLSRKPLRRSKASVSSAPPPRALILAEKNKLFHAAASAAQSGAQQAEHMEVVEAIRAHYTQQMATTGNVPQPATAVPTSAGAPIAAAAPTPAAPSDPRPAATSRTTAGAKTTRGNEGLPTAAASGATTGKLPQQPAATSTTQAAAQQLAETLRQQADRETKAQNAAIRAQTAASRAQREAEAKAAQAAAAAAAAERDAAVKAAAGSAAAAKAAKRAATAAGQATVTDETAGEAMAEQQPTAATATEPAPAAPTAPPAAQQQLPQERLAGPERAQQMIHVEATPRDKRAAQPRGNEGAATTTTAAETPAGSNHVGRDSRRRPRSPSDEATKLETPSKRGRSQSRRPDEPSEMLTDDQLLAKYRDKTAGWGIKAGETEAVYIARVRARLAGMTGPKGEAMRAKSAETRRAAAAANPGASNAATPARRRSTSRSQSRGPQRSGTSTPAESPRTVSLQLRLSQALSEDGPTNTDTPLTSAAATPRPSHP